MSLDRDLQNPCRRCAESFVDLSQVAGHTKEIMVGTDHPIPIHLHAGSEFTRKRESLDDVQFDIAKMRAKRQSLIGPKSEPTVETRVTPSALLIRPIGNNGGNGQIVK